MNVVWGEKKSAYWVWWGNPQQRDHLEDLGVDRKKILKRVLKTGVE